MGYRPPMCAGRMIDALLTDLSRPDGPEDPSAVASAWVGPDRGRTRDAVGRHRLEAVTADALRRAGAPPDPELDLLVADDRRVRLLAGRALTTAASALADRDVPWLVFKGPSIARLMPRPELRTFNDLDLLVAGPALGEAIDALVDVGAEELNENWTPYLRHRVGEVPMVMFGVTVDLHWHLPPPVAMLDRRVERTIADRATPVFDPIDQLLHLSVHAALGGGTRLDQFRDVAVVASGEAIDWDRFVDRARTAWVDGLVGHLLDRATLAGPASVPEEVVRDLAGDGSLRRRRRIDRGRVDGLRSLPVLWRRRRRRDVARVLVRRGLDRAAGPLHRGWDFTEPRSRLYHAHPSGGAAGRQAYLDAVAAGRL